MGQLNGDSVLRPATKNRDSHCWGGPLWNGKLVRHPKQMWISHCQRLNLKSFLGIVELPQDMNFWDWSWEATKFDIEASSICTCRGWLTVEKLHKLVPKSSPKIPARKTWFWFFWAQSQVFDALGAQALRSEGIIAQAHFLLRWVLFWVFLDDPRCKQRTCCHYVHIHIKLSLQFLLKSRTYTHTSSFVMPRFSVHEMKFTIYRRMAHCGVSIVGILMILLFPMVEQWYVFP